jgi:hypothetical protein
MVCTAIWFVFIGLMTYNTWPQKAWWEQSAQQSDAGKRDYFDRITGLDKLGKNPAEAKTSAEIDSEYRQSVWENLVMAAAMAGGLPAVLFLVGWALLWIGRGFRKT